MTNDDLKLNTDDSAKLADDIIKNLGQISKDEKGEAVANIAISYIKAMNELNMAHIASLKKALSLLNELDVEKKEVGEKIKIEKVRADLNN